MARRPCPARSVTNFRHQRFIAVSSTSGVNVVQHLAETHQVSIERRLKAAYAMSSSKDAKAELNRLVDYLERLNPSAGRSLEDGLEETLRYIGSAFPTRFE